VLHVVTASVNLGLMRGQLNALREAGFLVAAVSCPGWEIETLHENEGVAGFDIPMQRGVAPLVDPVSFWKLWLLLTRFHPQITNVSTIKAGLLGGLAARCVGVPCRVYTLNRLSFETARGVKRKVLKLLEKIACDAAHIVVCVSEGVREKAVEEGLVDPRRAVVLASGSGNGVDAAHFAPSEERRRQAQALRGQLGIPHDAPVIGFVGRVNSSKGVPELVTVFARLRHSIPGLRLLMLGDFESVDPLPPDTLGLLDTDKRILCPGYVADPAAYYQVMDVVCLPSRSEGFPPVLLEAQAAARPVVATAVTGCTDAIEPGGTGLLVPPDDLDALTAALEQVLTDPAQARRLGQAGRARVLHDFRPEIVWTALTDEYRRLLRQRGLPLPVRHKKEATEALTANSRVIAS
jgi:glycosyltransferase involved in cell wall biosynthesis